MIKSWAPVASNLVYNTVVKKEMCNMCTIN